MKYERAGVLNLSSSLPGTSVGVHRELTTTLSANLNWLTAMWIYIYN